jgi:CHAT domain-containing protein
VLASLWKVDDRATAALMSRFYDNLWTKRLPKAHALQEAQCWLLNEGRGRIPDAKRGLDLATGRPSPQSTGPLPPSYWAAFTLSGDWR